MKDFGVFCANLNSILETKFQNISKDYLYGRDINYHYYFQYLFKDITTIYSKNLIADKLCEVINSSYDWSYFFERNVSTAQNVNDAPSEEASEIKTIITPECDELGFSLCVVDDLDLLIIQILEKPLTIEQLVNELKTHFDEEDFKESTAEFEALLFLKIKRGLHNKSIRVVF
jgi:hypothetical protein